MKDIYIIGVHGFSFKSKRPMHNSGVALIKNGKVVFSIDEERFTREKNEGAFPNNALHSLFEETGIHPSEISYIAMPDRLALWQLVKIIKYIGKTYFETGVFANNYLRESLKRTLKFKRELPPVLNNKKVFYIEHHLAHAASAYYTSPWDSATIITVDGMGDFSMSGVVATGKEGKINLKQRLNGFYSPGLYYMIITEILGFVSGRHEGKVTGLAAYGSYNIKLDHIFKELISYDAQKSDFYSKNVAFEINDYISKHWVNGYHPDIGKGKTSEEIYESIKLEQLSTFRKILVGFTKEDIAFAAQKRLEEIITAHIKNVISKTGEGNIVLAGGVFANVKLNQRIRELDEVKGIYVYPAMSDSGLSVGAALYAHYSTLGNSFMGIRPPCVYLGTSYQNQEIKDAIIEFGLSYREPKDICTEIAELLAGGKTIAHFDGRAEYGPRALGNRSILASASDPSINITLNKKLNRTEFMPFAPMILEEHACELLIGWDKNAINTRFMTMTYPVTDKMKKIAPASVHVDDTVRPQVINQIENPRVYGILKSYYNNTGIPVLLNTSFNLHEEPIVNSPADALKIIQQNTVDVLAIGKYLINQQ